MLGLPFVGAVIVMTLALTLTGYFLVWADPSGLGEKSRRLCCWLLFLTAPLFAHILTQDAHPVVRMVVICLLMLAALKSLVYTEWVNERSQQGGRKLPGGHYLFFALAWFGMEPGAFEKRRAGLSWKSDIRIGLACMVAGTLGAFLVWEAGWRQVFVMFLPMSLGFHFGALRALKGLHRAAGFPVRTLFPNPLLTDSTADFWQRRWNIGYSQMMMRVVGRPIRPWLGRRGGFFLIFILSGLLHEVAISLPVQANFSEGLGLPTLYFIGHGLLIFAEKRLPIPAQRPLAFISVIAPLGLLFIPKFQEEVFIPCLGVLEKMKEAIF